MNAEETLKALTYYNRWRRGGHDALDMPCSTEIGEAIDAACKLIKQLIDPAHEQWRPQCLVARIQRDEALAMLKITVEMMRHSDSCRESKTGCFCGLAEAWTYAKKILNKQ